MVRKQKFYSSINAIKVTCGKCGKDSMLNDGGWYVETITPGCDCCGVETNLVFTCPKCEKENKASV
jgi:hypothetical protein